MSTWRILRQRVTGMKLWSIILGRCRRRCIPSRSSRHLCVLRGSRPLSPEPGNGRDRKVREVFAKNAKKTVCETALVTALLFTVPAIAQAPTPADAIALEQQGKLSEAAQAWKAVTERDPGDAAAFASLGVVLSKEQKYPEAAAAYRKALSLDPKLPGVD